MAGCKETLAGGLARSVIAPESGYPGWLALSAGAPQQLIGCALTKATEQR